MVVDCIDSCSLLSFLLCKSTNKNSGLTVLYPVWGVQWQSGKSAQLEIKGSQDQVLPEAFSCILEQETNFILILVLVQPRKHPGMTEILLTGT